MGKRANSSHFPPLGRRLNEVKNPGPQMFEQMINFDWKKRQNENQIFHRKIGFNDVYFVGSIKSKLIVNDIKP